MQAGTPRPRRAAPATTTAGRGGGQVGLDGVDAVEVAGPVLGERAGPAGDPDLERRAAQRHRVGQVGQRRRRPARRRRGPARRSSPSRPTEARSHTVPSPCEVRPLRRGPRAGGDRAALDPGHEEAAAVELAVDRAERSHGERDEGHRRVGDGGQQRGRPRRRAGGPGRPPARRRWPARRRRPRARGRSSRATRQPLAGRARARRRGRLTTSTPRAASVGRARRRPARPCRRAGAKNTGAVGSATAARCARQASISDARAAAGRGVELRHGGGQAQLVGVAGVDAADERVDQALGHLVAEPARG